MNQQPTGETLFGFHVAANALVFAGPDGRPMGITVTQLRAMGYNVTSEAFRSTLPRVDAPQIQTASAADLQKLNHRRR